MCRKSLNLLCFVLLVALAGNAGGAVSWTDDNGIASNHNWTEPGNWQTNEVPEAFDVVMINYPRYSKAPEAHGPIIDSNVGEIAHLKVGSEQAKQPAVLTVVDGGILIIKRTGQWPAGNGQLVIGQGGRAAGTVEMTGGKIIVESMCQLGRRPGQGLIRISGDAEFIVKGALKMGGMERGSGDAFIQLNGGSVKCDGLSMYAIESKMDIAGGRLIAGPGRLKHHSYRGTMEDYIVNSVRAGRITAYNGKGKLQWKLNSPEQGWIEVWAVLQDPNSTEEQQEKDQTKSSGDKTEKN